MPIDIGDIPTGTPPTTGEKLQIRTAIGLGQTDAPTFLAQTLTGALTASETGASKNPAVAFPVSGSYAVGVWSPAQYTIQLAMAPAGTLTNTTAYTGLQYEMTAGTLSWGVSSQTIKLARDADGILAQRNGTAAQTQRTYNNYTSATVFERGTFGFPIGTNRLQIGTEFLGSGMAALPIDFVTGGVVRMSLPAAGGVLLPSNSAINFGGGAGLFNVYGNTTSTSINGPNGFGQVSLAINGTTKWIVDYTGLFCAGGITSAFPAIKRNGTGIHIVLADDSGFAPLSSGALTISGGGANITGIVNGTAFTSGFYVQTNTQFMFGTGGVGDVALQKNATGVVEINNTTAGTFRDLRCRSVIQQPPAGAGAITPALNGDLVVEATSNTLLTFKFKGSDGTVRSGTMVVA
jgi:hypothetical protein